MRTGADGGRDHLVVSQCAHVCQRSVRFGDWMYIRTYHDGYHLIEDEELFNVKDDPTRRKPGRRASGSVLARGLVSGALGGRQHAQ